jgi:hypothetical protein
MQIELTTIQMTDEEIKVFLSVMSLVHPRDVTITGPHMNRIISVVMSRWYKCTVAWTEGYMNMKKSQVEINELESITYREIVDSLIEAELIIEARVPVQVGSRMTRKGYSLGKKSVNFLKQ